MRNIEQRISDMREGTLSLDELRDLASDIGTTKESLDLRDVEDVLVNLLGSADEIVRCNAVVSVGFDRKMITLAPRIKQMARSDSDVDCRGAAVSALGNLFQATSNPEVLSILIEIASGGDDVDEILQRQAYKAALIVGGVSSEEHVTLLRDQSIEIDPSRLRQLQP